MTRADLRGLDLAHLRAFDALMRERSVSRAAARLFLSQPALSAALKRLREVFGDPLFVRSPQGVTPTSRAHALAPAVEQVLQDLQHLLNTHATFDPTRSERILRIAGSDNLGRIALPPLCRMLAATGATVRIAWELADFAQVVDRLRRGDVQLGLIPAFTPVVGVDATMLYEDGYVVAGRLGHPLLADGPIDAARYARAPHAVLGQSRSILEDTIDLQLARAGLRRRIQVSLTSFGQIADLLAETDLLAMLPRRVARRHAARLRTSPVPFELPAYRLYLCRDGRAEQDDAVTWLRGEVMTVFTGLEEDGFSPA